jgi:hypothetical protein
VVDLLLMDGGRYGWVILGVLYLLFDVVLPMLKKRQQRQRRGARSQVHSALQPVVSAPSQPTFSAAVARGTESPRVPRPTRPSSTLTALVLEAYTPFFDQPGIAPIVTAQGLGRILSDGARRADFPASLDLVHQQLVSHLLHSAPGLRADIVLAAGLKQGIGEIQSIEELAKASDRLAVGWLDTVFADALGVTLFGPAYARLRVLRLHAQGRVHRLPLPIRGNRALALEPPLRIVGAALMDAVETLDMRDQSSELRALLQETEAGKGPLRLEITGGPRAIQFDVDAQPAITVTRNMMSSMLKTDLPALGDEALTDLARSATTADLARDAGRARKQLLAEGHLPVSGRARLMALLFLADQYGPAELRRLADASAQAAPLVHARDAAPERMESPRRAALIEAIVLGEILPRRGRS